MTIVKDANMNKYCSSVGKELFKIIKRIDALRINLRKEYGQESDIFRSSEEHLSELSADINRKRQLLLKNCRTDTRSWWDANSSLYRMLP